MAESSMQDDVRKWVAELIGTFFLTFAGVSAIIGTGGGGGASGLLVVALAHAGALALSVYALGPVSGSHINPAISLSVWIAKKMSTRDLVAYIIFQVIGATIGAALAAAIFSPSLVNAVDDGATLGLMTSPGPFNNPGSAFALELIMTFMLATAVASVVRGGKDMTPASGIVIGGTLFACILFGGPWTGASLNPARTMGPTLVHGSAAMWGALWLYWLAPLIGGALAGLVNAWLRNDLPKNPAPEQAAESKAVPPPLP